MILGALLIFGIAQSTATVLGATITTIGIGLTAIVQFRRMRVENRDQHAEGQAKVEASADKVAERLDALGESVLGGFVTIDQRFNRVDNQLASHDGDIAAIKATVHHEHQQTRADVDAEHVETRAAIEIGTTTA